MKVWIDQRACIGNGICAELAERVFAFDGDLAYVRDGDRVLMERDAIVAVAPADEASVLEAIDECPAACIYAEDG
jgi:ferredoxin